MAVLRASLPEGTALRRVPLNIADDRLLGGLDLSATLGAGRPVFSRGLLAEVGDGVLILAMAERLSAGTAARLAAATDDGARFGIVAFDEGADPDEWPPPGLMDRLAFPLALNDAVPDPGEELWADSASIVAARRRLPGVTADDAILEAICATAAALGVDTMRASIVALAAARAAAALAGRDQVSLEDAALAARLVLAPRATQLPPTADAERTRRPSPSPNQVQNPTLTAARTRAANLWRTAFWKRRSRRSRPGYSPSYRRRPGVSVARPWARPARSTGPASVADPPVCGPAIRGVACA